MSITDGVAIKPVSKGEYFQARRREMVSLSRIMLDLEKAKTARENTPREYTARLRIFDWNTREEPYAADFAVLVNDIILPKKKRILPWIRPGLIKISLSPVNPDGEALEEPADSETKLVKEDGSLYRREGVTVTAVPLEEGYLTQPHNEWDIALNSLGSRLVRTPV